MAEELENIKQKVQKFIEKILKNEDAKLNLTITEAQEVIWWWIYTEEFDTQEDAEDAVENMRVEFTYKKTTDGDSEKFIYQRIYNIKDAQNLEDKGLPIPIDEVMDNFN